MAVEHRGFSGSGSRKSFGHEQRIFLKENRKKLQPSINYVLLAISNLLVNNVFGRAEIFVLLRVDNAFTVDAQLFFVPPPGGEELIQLLVPCPVLSLGMARKENS